MSDTARIILVVVVGIALVVSMPLILLSTLDRPAEEQIRRVTKDGQECVVVERRSGRIDAITCDWSNR